jgi:hypothetical protein
MFEVRKMGLGVEMETIDGVTAPRVLLAEAKKLATETRKIHYVGVIEKKNPDFREPQQQTMNDIFLVIAEVLRPQHILSGTAARFLMTGEFILSDSHENVTLHEGCGRLIWVLPEMKAAKA